MPYPKDGDPCTTADGRSGYMVGCGKDGGGTCVAGDSFASAQAAAGTTEVAGPSDAPAGTEKAETMAERIARIKGEDTTSLNTAGNTSTTGDTAFRDESDPQRAAARTTGEAGPSAPGSDGSGATKSISADAAASALGEETAKVSSGSKQGEKVRETPAGRLAESNDVILGDQSTRAEGPKPGAPVTEYKGDGSRSPHDSTSEGGSRQAAAHAQVGAAADQQKEAAENPAFQAEAKTRTI